MQNKKNDFFSGAKGAVNYLLFCLIVVAFVLLCVCHTGCQITIEGIKVLGAEESPVLNSVNVIDEKTMEAHFSKQVVAECAYISKLGAEEKISIDCIAEGSIAVQSASADDGTTVVYTFPTGTQIGERYQLYSEVKDSRGNSLTFAMPFEGYNNRIPMAIITEVQRNTVNAAPSKNRNKEGPYITILALQDGNLFGLELYSFDKKKSYPLPVVEVKKDEYITLHLKDIKEPENCIDELGADLNLAKTGAAKPNYRDLYYFSGNGIGASADLILLRHTNEGEIIDAFTYTTESSTKWTFETELQQAISEGAWSGEPSRKSALDVTNAKGTTAYTRIFIPTQETKKPSSKEDWTFTKK